MKINGFFLRPDKIKLLLVCACVGIAGATEETGQVRATPAVTETRLRSILDCMSLGRSLFWKGDHVRAAMQFEKVLELDPSNSAAAELLQRCKEKLREKK